MNWAESEGIIAARGVRLFQQLHREGYFAGQLGTPVFQVPIGDRVYSRVPFLRARIDHVQI